MFDVDGVKYSRKWILGNILHPQHSQQKES